MQVVYVKFDNAAWKLEGINEAGVYPIRPITRPWELDKKRQKSILRVWRKQLPITPAYAMTAHASQGKTLPAVMVDLNVDSRVDGTFGVVAASRIRDRDDVLIVRPFPLWLFNRGPAEGPLYLLKHLRKEQIDWVAFRDAKAPEASCAQCKFLVVNIRADTSLKSIHRPCIL